MRSLGVNDKRLMMMVVDMVTFLDALATVDVPVSASNNDVDLVETRTVHFARSNRLLVLRENKQTRSLVFSQTLKYHVTLY